LSQPTVLETVPKTRTDAADVNMNVTY